MATQVAPPMMEKEMITMIFGSSGSCFVLLFAFLFASCCVLVLVLVSFRFCVKIFFCLNSVSNSVWEQFGLLEEFRV